MRDVIYPVRPGDTNDELRYSLRSLEAFFPDHGTVWVVGYKPNWLTGVEFIPGNTSASSQTNVFRNILTACSTQGVSDEVIVFNDDFFLTEPLTALPVYYRSSLDAHLRLPRVRMATNGKSSWWAESLRTTKICLQAIGVDDPLSYELHVPFPADRQLMADTLTRFSEITPTNPPQWRTLYGNLNIRREDSVLIEDSKAFRPGKLRTPFHSTTDLSWRHFRTALSTMFPDPSRYEAKVPARTARRA